MNYFRKFFWFCSGASQALLQRCPTEASKYTGIGATVFFTGLLGAISSGYALYTVFEKIWASLLFGLIWGCMIFNLDRFIVSSMKKKNNFWKEFKIAIPRLILATLLALVISKPLELKIFEKEINRQIDSKKNEVAVEAKAAIGRGFPEIEELEEKITILKAEITAKETFRNQRQQEYDFERFGQKTPGTTGIPGIGTNAKKRETQLDAAEKDLQETIQRNLTKIGQYEQEIARLHQSKTQEFDKQKTNIDRYDGLAARIDALSALSGESNAINLANIFIILLFIAIETAPVFVKLISEKGPYDYLLETHEHRFKNYKIEQVSKMNHETNKRLCILEADDHQIKEIRREYEEAQ